MHSGATIAPDACAKRLVGLAESNLVKGVSMAITLRTSFTSHINKNQGKVDSLISHLKR